MGDFRLSIFDRKFLESHVYKVDNLSFNIKRDSFGANGAKKLLDWNYFSLFTMIKCIWRKIRIFANLLINTYFLWCRAQNLMSEQINLNKKKFGHHTKLVGWHTSIINTILMFGYPKHIPSSTPHPPKNDKCWKMHSFWAYYCLKWLTFSQKGMKYMKENTYHVVNNHKLTNYAHLDENKSKNRHKKTK